MRVLLVGIPTILDPPLRQALADRHQPITFDGDERDLDACRQAADCDVVVHGVPASDDPLTDLDRASRATWNLLTTTNATRFVQISSMRLFDAYDPGWGVNESWYPRPSTDHRQLAPYLAEIAAREITRSRPITTLAVRLDEVVPAETFAAGPIEPTWLHIDDAVRALELAVDEPTENAGPRWSAVNIVRGDRSGRFPSGRVAEQRPGFAARHLAPDRDESPFPTPAWPNQPQPIDNLTPPTRVVIYGAGGPLGAITAEALDRKVQLRLCDRRALADVATSPPQSPGAPIPQVPRPPDEERAVDVTDPVAVIDAARGMDAIINCSVVRDDPVEAFRVNLLGAWNVMNAAVTLGIRRVIHTGPTLIHAPHPAGYNEDRDLHADAPPRPGDNLYFVSKFLGQELCRIFAETHNVAVISMLFSGFVNPAIDRAGPPGSFTISWNDAGQAMAAAVAVPRMVRPFQVVHVMANSPHDHFSTDATREILDWTPADHLDQRWYRR